MTTETQALVDNITTSSKSALLHSHIIGFLQEQNDKLFTILLSLYHLRAWGQKQPTFKKHTTCQFSGFKN